MSPVENVAWQTKGKNIPWLGIGRVAYEEVEKAMVSHTHTPHPTLLTHASSLGGLEAKSGSFLWCPFFHPAPHEREREQRRVGTWKPSLQFHADAWLGKDVLKLNCLSEQHLSAFSHEISEGIECNWSQGRQGVMSVLALGSCITLTLASDTA